MPRKPVGKAALALFANAGARLTDKPIAALLLGFVEIVVSLLN